MSEYDTDLLVWSGHHAALLRRMGAGERVNDQVDWENVAEEIGSLGRSDKRALHSRIRTVLERLIKLQLSPVIEPRSGWRRTMIRERDEIGVLIKGSPSLPPIVPAVIDDELPAAWTVAMDDLADFGKHAGVDAAGLTFTAEQLLGPWLPDG